MHPVWTIRPVLTDPEGSRPGTIDEILRNDEGKWFLLLDTGQVWGISSRTDDVLFQPIVITSHKGDFARWVWTVFDVVSLIYHPAVSRMRLEAKDWIEILPGFCSGFLPFFPNRSFSVASQKKKTKNGTKSISRWACFLTNAEFDCSTGKCPHKAWSKCNGIPNHECQKERHSREQNDLSFDRLLWEAEFSLWLVSARFHPSGKDSMCQWIVIKNGLYKKGLWRTFQICLQTISQPSFWK
jgi:hypothetical protein